MEHTNNPNESTISQRSMELVVAAAFMAFACLVMWDNWRIGAGWGADGPGAGYFPFYMGVIMFIASAGTFVSNVITKTPDRNDFVERSQLVLVLKVLVPTIALVVLINFLGLYVASAIFIAFFMTWLGKYPFYKTIPIAIGVPLVLFIMFEIWFLVPLPKGPIENALGY